MLIGQSEPSANKILSEYVETWYNGISATYWTKTEPATGSAWNLAAWLSQYNANAWPNATENTRLVSTKLWQAPIAQGLQPLGTNLIVRKLGMEFSFLCGGNGGSPHINNNTTFMGFTPLTTDKRSTIADIFGFGFSAGALQSVFKNAAGTVQSATGFGETLTEWNKLKIEIDARSINYYLNETLAASFEISDNILANGVYYPNFYFEADAVDNFIARLGIIHVWQEREMIPK